MPTITQLEYIVAVDRLRHFGKAAKASHVTQPSLSMQIQKAEEELGVTIFDRNKKPVLATEQGARIIEQAKAILREHERLLQLSHDTAGELSGDFRLGVIPTLAPYLVPLFIERFSETHPKVRLFIDELKTEEILDSLKHDTLDAGLLVTPLSEKGIRERKLFLEPFFLYVHPKHPLAARKKIQEGDLDGGDIWLLQDGHCLRNQVINYCSLKIDQPAVFKNVRFEGGNLETLRNLIAASGRGYTLLPYLFVKQLGEDEKAASVRPFASPIPTREVSIVHRRDHWKSDIIVALAEKIKAAVPKELLSLKPEKAEVVSID